MLKKQTNEQKKIVNKRKGQVEIKKRTKRKRMGKIQIKKMEITKQDNQCWIGVLQIYFYTIRHPCIINICFIFFNYVT
jgi:hypothetical protein